MTSPLRALEGEGGGVPRKVTSGDKGDTEGHAIVKFRSCLDKTSKLRLFRGLTTVPLGSFMKT